MHNTQCEAISISKVPVPYPASGPDFLAPSSQLADPQTSWKTKPSSEPLRSATNGAVVTKPVKPSPVARDGLEHEPETFDAPVHHPYDFEIKKTAEEADKELKELFQGGIEDGPAEIDMGEAIVDGFADDIILKPHQVRS